MKDLYYCKDITKIDSLAQNQYNQPGIILMEQAGLKTWLYIKDKIKKDENITVVCGGGNNGGDALVVARCAYNDGYKNINIIYCSTKFSDSFEIQDKIIRSYNLPITSYLDNKEKSLDIINNATHLIDGIIGVGLKSNLRLNLVELIKIINASSSIKYCIDVPSGLSDVVSGICVKANFTFCMGPLKALYYYPKNIEKCNEIIEINPSFPPQVIEKVKPIAQLEENHKVDILPLNKSDYKKTRGHLASFGGSNQYSGALRLTSKAAFSSRCGLVTAFCDSQIYNVVASESPSIIVKKLEDGFDLKCYNAILAGPGWDKNREELLLEILSYNKPTVIDADGIRAYAHLYREKKINIKENEKLIFTPHLGELKVLADSVLEDYSIDNIESLLDTLTKLSSILNATIVCKASVVYIVSPNKLPLIIYNLNPSLAVAGSGDILAGCIASFLCNGFSTYKSAKEGVLVHINAGKLAKKELGYYSSEQLIEYIGKQLL
ncbi:MAG: NAD(P)H-hydrate dehydratase [Sphaerochaetaceae bacterium]|nr:NAD(P)H-hydrate dehydratase [Sphaerochaetaceae bacterium]